MKTTRKKQKCDVEFCNWGKWSGSTSCHANKTTKNCKHCAIELSTAFTKSPIQLENTVDEASKNNDEIFSIQLDRISVYIQSKMERVDFGGLADKSYHSMVEQMLLSLNIFASNHSVCTLDQIENIEVRLVKNKSLSASSHLALFGMSVLLNIRNREDEHCFLYSNAAAYFLKYGPRLVPVGSSSRRITSLATYGPWNPIAKQASGEFKMPMRFRQMARLE